MDLNTLISQYGYAALVLGSLAEGETVTLLGGVAAHQGLLKFPLVVLSVALGGMIGDQVLYLCGRRFGGKLLRRFSSSTLAIGVLVLEVLLALPVILWGYGYRLF